MLAADGGWSNTLLCSETALFPGPKMQVKERRGRAECKVPFCVQRVRLSLTPAAQKHIISPHSFLYPWLAQILTYSTVPAIRLCVDGVQIYGENGTRLSDVLPADGRLTYRFARQKNQLTRVHTDGVPTRDRANEDALYSPSTFRFTVASSNIRYHLLATGTVIFHEKFAFRATLGPNHSLESVSASATGLSSPGDKVELKQFVNSFQDTMDQKPYRAMLRGELTYAALQLAPRNLDDIPPIADTTTGPCVTKAALRPQVKHENKMKQESKEPLDKHALPMYLSMYDGMQMFNELKDELINLHDA
eukprot:6206906-Pleurochrysis_carterae.AAC.4